MRNEESHRESGPCHQCTCYRDERPAGELVSRAPPRFTGATSRHPYHIQFGGDGEATGRGAARGLPH